MIEALSQHFLRLRALAKASVHLAILALGLGAAPVVLLPILAAGGALSAYCPAAPNRGGARVIAWAATFAALSALSVAVGADPARGILFLLTYVPCGVVFIIIVRLFDLRDLIRLGVTLSVLAGLMAVKLAILHLTAAGASPSRLIEQAALPLLGVPNDLTLLAVAAPLTAALLLLPANRPARRRWSWPARLLLSTALLTSAAVIVAYQSRSALLMLLTGLVALAVLLAPTKRTRLMLVAAVAGLGLLGALLDALVGAGMLAKFSDPVRWTRLRLWLSAWQMFIDAPWLGHGPGSFSVLYEHYAATLTLPDWLRWDRRHMPWAHNLYLELLAERGLLGTLCFTGWIWSSIGALTGTLRHAGPARPVAAAALSALLVILAAGLLDLSLLRLWVVLMLTITTAAVVVLSRNAANGRNATA